MASGTGELSPRERRRQQRQEVGREQILDAAEELFGRQGYRQTSLAQVARRAEYSTGALYLFFDSKEDLLGAVLSRRAADLMGTMRTCVEATGPARALLVDLARTQIAFHRRYPDFGRLSVRMFSPGIDAFPDFGGGLERGYEAAVRLETTLIERGQAEGTVRSGDPHCLARLFSAMVTAYHAMDPEVTGDGGLADADFLDSLDAAFAPTPSPQQFA